MLCRSYAMISSVELAHYGVSRAKDWVSVDCDTSTYKARFLNLLPYYLRPFIAFMKYVNVRYFKLYIRLRS